MAKLKQHKGQVINPSDILRHGGDVEAALAEKREQAIEELEATGSLPPWWDHGVSLGRKKGAPSKFKCVDEYFSLGFEYFEDCAKLGQIPTKGGLILKLGFANLAYAINHMRRNPEYREAFATLMHMLTIPLEQELLSPAGQAGKMFLIKNIPEGLLPEDPSNAPMRYSWKDRQTQEITGADGGPLVVSREMPPEEAYRAMLEGGTLDDES